MRGLEGDIYRILFILDFPCRLAFIFFFRSLTLLGSLRFADRILYDMYMYIYINILSLSRVFYLIFSRAGYLA